MKKITKKFLRSVTIKDPKFKRPDQPGPIVMLGYARKLRTGTVRRASDLLRELREGEQP